MASEPGRRSGRRTGDTITRERITEAARRQFAEVGYDRTSLRSIAQEAGVDPTLVSHFYGSKAKLFVSVVELPFDPPEVLSRLLADDPATVGPRLAHFVLGVLESEHDRQRLVGLVRAAATEPEAARLVRDLVSREIFVPLTARISADHADLRASLLGSQLVGLVMARHIVQVEPLASSPPEAIAAIIGPLFQHLLTGKLEP